MRHVYRSAASRLLGLPSEVREMLDRFTAMVNWLISYTVWSKCVTEDGRTDKNLLEEQTTEWFEQEWRGHFAAHYHEAAISLAAQQVDSWRALGGNTSSLPYITKPMARLRADLFKVKFTGNKFVLSITLQPTETVTIEGTIEHGKFDEYSSGDLGEIVVFPDHVNFCWSHEDARPKAEHIVVFDTNMSDLVGATDDGKFIDVLLQSVVDIQKKERDARHRIQKATKNVARQERLLRRRSGRERERIEQAMLQRSRTQTGVIPDLLARTAGYGIVFDDLKTTSRECVVVGAKRFNERLSAWVHGRVQELADSKSPFRPSKRIYTRGTSTYCPFCNSRLTHPDWHRSKCAGCGLVYDRDRLSAVSNLVRAKAPSHRKGEAWALAKEVLSTEVVRSLQDGATIQVLRHDEQETREPPLEQRVREVPTKSGGLLLSASHSTGEGTASPASAARTAAGLKTAMTPTTTGQTSQTRNATKNGGLVDV